MPTVCCTWLLLLCRQLQQLEGAGPSLKPFFCFTPYERQSGKKRAFGEPAPLLWLSLPLCSG